VYGYARGILSRCYYDRLELRDYLHLGETDAEVLVIATHYFTSPRGEVGLGTSEPVPAYYPLVHPVRALQVVKGVLPRGVYAAVPPRVIEGSNLRGKTVVLLTCSLPRIDEVAEAFVRAGARLVAVSSTPALQPAKLRYLLELVSNSTPWVARRTYAVQSYSYATVVAVGAKPWLSLRPRPGSYC